MDDNGNVARRAHDSNGDGRVDQHWTFDPSRYPSRRGCASIAPDLDGDGKPDPGQSPGHLSGTGCPQDPTSADSKVTSDPRHLRLETRRVSGDCEETSRKVYNSAGMEPLAPEDLVEDWSDLYPPALSAPARASVATSCCCPSPMAAWRGCGRRAFMGSAAFRSSSPSRPSCRTWRMPPSSSTCFSTRRASRRACIIPTSPRFYELGEEGHVLYLAMEWVNGESLVHVVRGKGGRSTARRAARGGAHRGRGLRRPARGARAAGRRRADR